MIYVQNVLEQIIPNDYNIPIASLFTRHHIIYKYRVRVALRHA